MELQQLETYLESPNPQERMKAITGLRDYEPDVVVPLLLRRIKDKEFIVRSFVAIGLGRKRSDEAFTALTDLIKYDNDPNVRAEAANSLAYYGDTAVSHLQELFERDSHWLVRQSILAALDAKKYPEIFLHLCGLGVAGEEPVIKLEAIGHLTQLAETTEAEAAIDLLLPLIKAESSRIRAQVARSLTAFEDSKAKAALLELRKDSDYRVVSGTLEGLLPTSND